MLTVIIMLSACVKHEKNLSSCKADFYFFLTISSVNNIILNEEFVNLCT